MPRPRTFRWPKYRRSESRTRPLCILFKNPSCWKIGSFFIVITLPQVPPNGKFLLMSDGCHLPWHSAPPSSLGVTCALRYEFLFPFVAQGCGIHWQRPKDCCCLLEKLWASRGYDFPMPSAVLLGHSGFSEGFPATYTWVLPPWASLTFPLRPWHCDWSCVGWNLVCPAEEALESHRLGLSQTEVFGLHF